ncbi:hypothetical protein DICVIV_06368 [Dictyocaulus viviparus]|uniref:Uncharacterized protein n=1 Tax=Dictyocaulus viviparus TaxID=29172 RepID=A0A0D8XUL8_DICVI|nr:hypothetical protein DICVIV_06368 [Dictyocaulus viviparus]
MKTARAATFNEKVFEISYPTFATYIMFFGNLNSCVNPWIWFCFNRSQIKRALSCPRGMKSVVCGWITKDEVADNSFGCQPILDCSNPMPGTEYDSFRTL